MLRCINCKGPVDVNAAACPRCGRPQAGEEAAKLQSGGCLAIVIAVIGLGVYSKFFGESDPAQTKQAAPIESVQPSTVSNDQSSIEGSPQIEPSEIEVPQEESKSNLGGIESPDLQGGFLFDAILTDKRGEIILQSKASVFSKNVAVLAPGASVKAESTSGEWIRVLTSDGLVGYVRSKQLVFSDQNQL